MNSAKAMWHLLWKDFYQVRAALAGCLAMLACIQMWYLAIELYYERDGMLIFQKAFMVALVAPTLAAMACSGLLIGHERQTRTWNWSSSLPISWYAALASKFVVWLLASVLMTALLLLFYSLLFRIGVLVGRTSADPALWTATEESFLYTMIWLVPLEAFVLFSIAALLGNDTLLAFVIAAIVLALGHVFLVDYAVRWVHGIRWNVPLQMELYLDTAVGLLTAAIVIASLALFYVFRWRWTTGQLASISLLPTARLPTKGGLGRALPPYASVTGALVPGKSSKRVLSRSIAPPSATRVMFQHAWRSSLGARLAIVGSAVGLLALWPQFHLLPLIISVTSLLLGVTVFGGEQPLKRYRFFADRGASWLGFLVSHVLVAAVWLWVFLVAAYATQSSRAHSFGDIGVWEGIAVALAAFGAGVFASLCSASPVIALALAPVTLSSFAVAYVLADAVWQAATGLSGYMAVELALAIAILVAALLHQTRRWFIQERPRAMVLWLGAWLLAWAVPVGLVLTFGFLTIPRVPWEGIPAGHVEVNVERMLPAFVTDMPDTEASVAIQPLPSRLAVAGIRLLANYQSAVARNAERFGSVELWLRKWELAIHHLEDEISQGEFTPPTERTIFLYSQWLEQSALVALAATQAREADRALAAWKLNRGLLELSAGDLDLATRSLVARNTSWGMWSLLTEQDWEFLHSKSDVERLLPNHIASADWELMLKKRWAVRRLALRDERMRGSLAPLGPQTAVMQVGKQGTFWPVIQGYAPLRWATERIMAIRLAKELEMLQHGTSLPRELDEYRAVLHDPMAFELELLQQLEQQVNAEASALQ